MQLCLAKSVFCNDSGVVLLRSASVQACPGGRDCERERERAQHLRGMLFLNRQPAEQWAAWQIRTLCLARVHLQRNKLSADRVTSSSGSGHCGGTWPGGGAEVNSMVTWKDMQFWRAQQQLPRKQRVTHASRFNPEADVEKAVAGTHWGDIAQDRHKWQELSLVFWRNSMCHGQLESS